MFKTFQEELTLVVLVVISAVYFRPDMLSKVGYCPQFDALYDELTVREHFFYYSLVRGYSCSSAGAVCSFSLIST